MSCLFLNQKEQLFFFFFFALINWQDLNFILFTPRNYATNGSRQDSVAFHITEINGLRKISPKSAKNNLLILQFDSWCESFQLVSSAIGQTWEKTETVNREGNLHYRNEGICTRLSSIKSQTMYSLLHLSSWQTLAATVAEHTHKCKSIS